MPETYKDESWLREQYVQRKRTQADIGAECGVTGQAIGIWLQKFNIETRGKDRNKSVGKINKIFDSFITGSLLGDGSLRKRSPQTARFVLEQKHKEYCSWIRGLLETNGIKYTKNYFKRTKNGTNTYKIMSHSYTELGSIYDRWYKEQKNIPRDLELNPISLRHWFIEDGYVNKHDWGTVEIGFATNGFTMEGVEVLGEKLSNTIKVKNEMIHVRDHSGPVIQFGEPEVVKKFYEFLAPLPEELKNVYGYKWIDKYA